MSDAPDGSQADSAASEPGGPRAGAGNSAGRQALRPAEAGAAPSPDASRGAAAEAAAVRDQAGAGSRNRGRHRNRAAAAPGRGRPERSRPGGAGEARPSSAAPCAPSSASSRTATARSQAAFFDLDKTVIAKASMVAFGRPFYHGGLINRRTVLRALYGELVYLHLGASEQKLNRIRESVLRLIKGWHRDRVREIVAEAIEAIVEPIIFAEAADLIDWHHEQGRLVVIVSASPEEIVTPLSRFLGADDCIASRAQRRRRGPLHRQDAVLRLRALQGRGDGRPRGRARHRPRRLVRLHRFLHRPADARGRRPPRCRQPRPGAPPLRAASTTSRCSTSARP